MIKNKFSMQSPRRVWAFDGIDGYNTSFLLSGDISESRTQDEHALQRKKAKRNEFYVECMPFYHSLFTTLYKNRKNNDFKNGVEEVRQFISESLFEYPLTTLTRVRYNPDGKNDLIVHDYKQPQQFRIKLDSIVGPNGYILGGDQDNIEKPLQILLGTNQSLQEINDVYMWLTAKSVYLKRINETPKISLESVAVFTSYSGWSGLDCYRGTAYSDTALLVREVLKVN
jgi:hypothetical protein